MPILSLYCTSHKVYVIQLLIAFMLKSEVFLSCENPKELPRTNGTFSLDESDFCNRSLHHIDSGCEVLWELLFLKAKGIFQQFICSQCERVFHNVMNHI